MFQENQQIGVYTLICKLGRGGFGEVWLAERRSKFVTTKVAVKLPHGDQVDHAAIEQEATLWERASGHPNVLPIIEAHEYDGQIVIVSEYAPDGSLEEWLKKHGRMSVAKAIETTIEILDGLEFLHRRDIIHRDIKPANILLQGDIPRLADFGISRVLRSTMSSRSDNITGTFAYMPPEGFDGRRSVQTDIWAVGVNLYRFITGELPFPQKEPTMLIAAIMMRDFEPLPADISPGLKKVITKALAKLPNDRYESAAALRSDLRQVLQAGPGLPTQKAEPVGPLQAPQFEQQTAETALNKGQSVPIDDHNPVPDSEGYLLPLSLLTLPPPSSQPSDEEFLAIAHQISEKLGEFNISGRVEHIVQGPVVTTYEFKPDPGVKYSRIMGLVDDLSLALKTEAVQIKRIPGKANVGIEIPNLQRETIYLREGLESKKFRESGSPVTMVLGRTTDGLNFVSDLTELRHLFILGTTGSGKSIFIHTLIVSILYKAAFQEVKFILIDPKHLELGLYDNIPHLATPVITDPRRGVWALKWAVSEMERRYRDLAAHGVRNFEGYNGAIRALNAAGHIYDQYTGQHLSPLPYIVIIIEEISDLVGVPGKEVEDLISRLAQRAHVVGIHLVVSAQNSSNNIVSKLTKENFPSRIAFRVLTKSDSRLAVNTSGAENLPGKGEMLFLPPETQAPVHIHTSFVDERDIFRVVEHLKARGGPDRDVPGTIFNDELAEPGDLPGKRDPLFWDAVKSVVSAKRASTSLLQRHLRIGYGRTAAILDAMVKEGYVGDMDGSTRTRPVLQKAYEDLTDFEEMGDY